MTDSGTGLHRQIVERIARRAMRERGLLPDFSRKVPDELDHIHRPASCRKEELKSLAAHCTAKETDAEKVERRVQKSATALLLESKVGQRFDAMVTGASNKGTWVRLFSLAVEGRLVSGFDGLDVGDRVQVDLISMNVERGYIDFAKAGP